MRHRLALANSAVAFALALLAMITLHEIAHGVAALIQGQRPVIFPGSENDNAVTVGAKVFIALGGPLWSLLSGALVLALPQVRGSSPFWRLAVLWFGLLSVQEFSGYLIVGLFTDVGDIGASYELLGTPFWLKLVLFAIGCVLTYFTGRIATQRLLKLTDPAAEIAPQLRELGLFAWLLGVAISVIVSLPGFLVSTPSANVLFELLGTLTSGIFLVWVRWFMQRLQVRHQSPRFGWPIGGVVALIALALVRIAVFGPGLTL